MGTLSLVAPLGAFREEQAMSWHRVSPFPFLSSSSLSHTTQTVTHSHPNLNSLQYIIQMLVPHVMWSAQEVHDSKIDQTQRHLSALRGTWNSLQWVGIGTNIHTHTHFIWNDSFIWKVHSILKYSTKYYTLRSLNNCLSPFMFCSSFTFFLVTDLIFQRIKRSLWSEQFWTTHSTIY